ncbi:MAG: hypothetical protein GY835_20100 [bacterium]|nr:hypothetical protein [bacterium]
MSAMQRLNILAALLMFIYGTWQGWPVINSLEKAFLAYVITFGAQILTIVGFLRLTHMGGAKNAE